MYEVVDGKGERRDEKEESVGEGEMRIRERQGYKLSNSWAASDVYRRQEATRKVAARSN